MGGILSYPSLGVMNEKMMDVAGKVMPIAMLVLIVKIGLGIGPNLHMLLNSGWALIMQELGHFVRYDRLRSSHGPGFKDGPRSYRRLLFYRPRTECSIIAEKYGIFSPEAAALWGCTSAAPCSARCGFLF